MSPLDRIRWTAAVASVRLPATCYRLAAHMAAVACDGSGTAWASRLTLARAICCDEARLKPAFRAMETAGFIVRGDLAGPNGHQTYRWHLAIPGADVAPGAEGAPGAEVARPGGAEVTWNRGRKSPPKGGREGGSKGGRGKRSLRFAPPTLVEVSDYCTGRQNGIDPQRFLDHYSARGWMIGKSKVKDWKACIRTWEANDRAKRIEQVADHQPERPQPGADALAAAAEVEAEIHAKEHSRG